MHLGYVWYMIMEIDILFLFVFSLLKMNEFGDFNYCIGMYIEMQCWNNNLFLFQY